MLNTVADTLPEEEAVGDTCGDTHALIDNPAVTLPEVETVTLGDARGSADALVDTLVETLEVMEVVGETRSHSHALVETLANTLAEMEARTLRDTQGNAQTLDRQWLTRLQRWRQ